MKSLSPSITAVLAGSFVIANTLFWAPLVYLLVFAKLLLPWRSTQRIIGNIATWLSESWVGGNNFASERIQGTHFELQAEGDIRPDESYLIICNHQSWVDIPALQRVFHRRIPFLRFFIKDALKYLPVLGQAWWALDMPFMKRYSREEIQRRPELKGKDLEATRVACRKLAGRSISIINFVEGTRFTQKKHDQQESPYRNLLRPRAGGVAYAIAAMEGSIRAVLDVTLIYPLGTPTFREFMGGQVSGVVVRARRRDIPADLLHGDYENDPEYRARFQAWIGRIWAEKDDTIDELRAGLRAAA